jgi:large subunit ribosomal protein L22
MVGYSQKSDPATTARAIGRDIDISPKHSEAICDHIRGWPLERAKDFLGEVVEEKKAVPFRRYGSAPHRKGRVGPGRFPKKAAAAILRVLAGAEANAEYKGLTVDEMVITHIATNQGRTTESYFRRARGRSTPKNRQTVNVEVILRESKEKEE